jgi:hypothetical protein
MDPESYPENIMAPKKTKMKNFNVFKSSLERWRLLLELVSPSRMYEINRCSFLTKKPDFNWKYFHFLIGWQTTFVGCSTLLTVLRIRIYGSGFLSRKSTMAPKKTKMKNLNVLKSRRWRATVLIEFVSPSRMYDINRWVLFTKKPDFVWKYFHILTEKNQWTQNFKQD